MKYLTEYRDPVLARALVDRIRRLATRRWTLMEVCGGQTHTIVKQGIDEVLSDAVEMIHGPGCPVCVTPLEQIDRALHLAARPDVIFTSFGDMLRVPGSECNLLQVKARGGDVRIVYSPLDAVELARRNPDKEVVFFAVGFETTAPANAMAVWRANGAGRAELQRPGLPRDGPAGDGGDPGRARQPGAGLPGGRPRLHGDGLDGVRAAGPPLPRSQSW